MPVVTENYYHCTPLKKDNLFQNSSFCSLSTFPKYLGYGSTMYVHKLQYNHSNTLQCTSFTLTSILPMPFCLIWCVFQALPLKQQHLRMFPLVVVSALFSFLATIPYSSLFHFNFLSFLKIPE